MKEIKATRDLLLAEVVAYADTLNAVVAGTANEDCYSRDADGEECDDAYTRLDRYFEYTYDVEFIIGGRKDFRGAVVLLASGGPTIKLDTRDGLIKGWWCSDYCERYLAQDAEKEVDEYFSEMWERVNG